MEALCSSTCLEEVIPTKVVVVFSGAYTGRSTGKMDELLVECGMQRYPSHAFPILSCQIRGQCL